MNNLYKTDQRKHQKAKIISYFALSQLNLPHFLLLLQKIKTFVNIKMATPKDILLQYWGHAAFRPLQEEIINTVLSGKDVLALLPTGGGKSVCFQVPALAMEGLCLVISPLIALMKDQVENLKNRNIQALSLQSGMSHPEVKETLQNAAYGPYKFLYVSPERLESALFKEYLPALPLNLIAIDEAHCISQWGYDFRPPYLRIANLRKEFPTVPMLALTASATPVVQQDICDKLLFSEPAIFRQSFEKPNLSFSLFNADSKINKLLDILQKVPGTAIVYCRNRRRTKEIANLLSLNKISADFYHAGLSQNERSQRQEDWIKNKVRVIVCTNAFGMGIDKPDVRVVVHMDIPDNLENYYQEAGRAGRDGKISFAVLLYSKEEFDALQKLPDIKYPPLAEIKKIYQAVANFLQLPTGSGEGLYYEFNLKDFVSQFKLDAMQVVNALKALEQEGHLSFNEQVFLPAKIGFTCGKEDIDDFEKTQPQYEELIKALLRSYHGIFDNEVSVSEKLICRMAKISPEELKKKLADLVSYNVIQYHPQKETPQIYFLQNRASADYITFDNQAYLKRKHEYKLRIETMQQYILLDKKCRSQYIGNYFGDKEMKLCGVCDNCLAQKNATLSTAEFDKIKAAIFQLLHSHSIDIKGMLDSLKKFKKEKIWTVINFLQNEGKLKVNEQGLVSRQ